MSLLGDSLSSVCVLLLVFCGPVFCHDNTGKESRSLELLFRQAQDLGAMYTDVKRLLMLQSMHYRDLVTKIEAISQASEAKQERQSMLEEMKTLQSEHYHEIVTKMNEMQNMQARHDGHVVAKMDVISDLVVAKGCAGNVTGISWIFAMGIPITVPCDGLGWIVLLRRVDGSYNFPDRTWEDYKNGFGDRDASFWIGLENIHRLTTQGQARLRVELEAFNGESRFAEYENFRVEGEEDKYRLRVSGYSGTAGDSLVYHNNWRFSTKDKDHDGSTSNCAEKYKGAWWYNKCHHSNLNSVYSSNGTVPKISVGLIWRHWKGYEYSYKRVVMKIRV